MKTKPSLLERFLIVFFAACVFLLAWAILDAIIGRVAHAEVLEIRHGYATTSGIEAGATSPEYYARTGSGARSAPMAGVTFLAEPAPPNGCDPAGFRVITGSRSEKGCFGRR